VPLFFKKLMGVGAPIILKKNVSLVLVDNVSSQNPWNPTFVVARKTGPRVCFINKPIFGLKHLENTLGIL
jgi:hypothetical protein